MSSPRVTVLMPIYNGEAFVRDAVESILTQTYRNFELLVVDDGSTDATLNIVRSYDDDRLRVLQNAQNLGLPAALNVGVRAARGALIARQDVDDISYPDRLKRQVAFLDANPAVVVLGTQFVSLNERGRRRPLHLWMKCRSALGIRWQLMFENAFVHSSVMFRRDVVLTQFDGYDERFPACEDVDLWARVARRYPLRNLPEFLMAYRGRTASVSGTYSVVSLKKGRDVYAAYAADTVGLDPVAEEGLDTLMQGMSPRVYPPLDSLRPVVRWIDWAYGRFVERWPEAARIGEIRAQAASLVGRLATLSANERPLRMSRWYMEAARYHLPTFARGTPRFTVACGRALSRRRR